MNNTLPSSPLKYRLTRAEARQLAEGFWRGRLAKSTRLGRLVGLLLIGIALLVRFLVELPREHAFALNNIVFFTGLALLFFASVALPVATQSLLVLSRRVTAPASDDEPGKISHPR